LKNATSGTASYPPIGTDASSAVTMEERERELEEREFKIISDLFMPEELRNKAISLKLEKMEVDDTEKKFYLNLQKGGVELKKRRLEDMERLKKLKRAEIDAKEKALTKEIEVKLEEMRRSVMLLSPEGYEEHPRRPGKSALDLTQLVTTKYR
jgi:hypothetical protein